jgi:hypothetical protein
MIERLAIFAALASLVVRWLTGQWPWELWQRRGLDARAGQAREKRARVLLGVPADAARADIIEAHRRLITQVHPDRGGTSEAVHEANDARDLLLERLGPQNRG